MRSKHVHLNFLMFQTAFLKGISEQPGTAHVSEWGVHVSAERTHECAAAAKKHQNTTVCWSHTMIKYARIELAAHTLESIIRFMDITAQLSQTFKKCQRPSATLWELHKYSSACILALHLRSAAHNIPWACHHPELCRNQHHPARELVLLH